LKEFSKAEDLLKQSRVVAVGECGLDYSYLKDFSEMDKIKYRKIEEEEFRKQIQSAKRYNLPLSLHVRNLYEKALIILEEEEYKGNAVFHFFTGKRDQAKKILQNGFHLGFSGVITYSEIMHDAIEYIPLEKILIETDAPYVAPIPYKGNRNEPIYVKEIAKKIAEIKKLPLKEVEEVRQHVVVDSVVKNGEIKEVEDKRFIRMADSFINIDDLHIDLIDRVNPFQKAFEILSKSVTTKVLKVILTNIILRLQLEQRCSIIKRKNGSLIYPYML